MSNDNPVPDIDEPEDEKENKKDGPFSGLTSVLTAATAAAALYFGLFQGLLGGIAPPPDALFRKEDYSTGLAQMGIAFVVMSVYVASALGAKGKIEDVISSSVRWAKWSGAVCLVAIVLYLTSFSSFVFRYPPRPAKGEATRQLVAGWSVSSDYKKYPSNAEALVRTDYGIDSIEEVWPKWGLVGARLQILFLYLLFAVSSAASMFLLADVVRLKVKKSKAK